MKKISLLALSALAVPASATGPAVQSFSGGTEFASFFTSAQATPDMVGFQFTANSDLMVTDLGFWVASVNNPGLDSDHQVLLWETNSSTLIASATITANSVANGDWVYTAITPVALSSGTQYSIAADYWSGGLDWYISGATSASYDSDITFDGRLAPTAIDLGYVMPTAVATGNGRFGPNMITEAVPEPASMSILVLGVAALARRKRKA